MNDGLSNDTKKKFMLLLTIDLQDHKEKVFHIAQVSHTSSLGLMNQIVIHHLEPISQCNVSSLVLLFNFPFQKSVYRLC